MSSKYEFIEGEKANYPVVSMCRWAGVSRSGFYEWRTRPDLATTQRRQALGDRIVEIFNEADGAAGYRKVHHQLSVNEGVGAGLELVRKIMRERDLVACQPRPYKVTTINEGDEGPGDLVGRDFTADEPGTKLVSDITYIRTWAGWVYLATVIDCYSRMVVGFAMADHMRASLVTAALDMARTGTDLADGCVFHSDRGSQYTSAELAGYLDKHGMRGSMGRTGICWDNAMAESCFATLKNEFVYRTVFPTRGKAIDAITNWIVIRYNRKGLHAGIGYRIPAEVHNAYQPQHQAA